MRARPRHDRDVRAPGVFQMSWGAPAGIVSMTPPRRTSPELSRSRWRRSRCARPPARGAPRRRAAAPTAPGGGTTSTTTTVTSTTTTDHVDVDELDVDRHDARRRRRPSSPSQEAADQDRSRSKPAPRITPDRARADHHRGALLQGPHDRLRASNPHVVQITGELVLRGHFLRAGRPRLLPARPGARAARVKPLGAPAAPDATTASS